MECNASTSIPFCLSQVRLLQNIIGYLASSAAIRATFLKVRYLISPRVLNMMLILLCYGYSNFSVPMKVKRLHLHEIPSHNTWIAVHFYCLSVSKATNLVSISFSVVFNMFHWSFVRFQVVGTLLTVWGDASALKHTSYEHHLYISQAIIVCMAFLSKQDTSSMKSGRWIHWIMGILYRGPSLKGHSQERTIL